MTINEWMLIDERNELALQQAIAEVGPVAVAVDADYWLVGGKYSSWDPSNPCSSWKVCACVLTEIASVEKRTLTVKPKMLISSRLVITSESDIYTENSLIVSFNCNFFA